MRWFIAILLILGALIVTLMSIGASEILGYAAYVWPWAISLAKGTWHQLTFLSAVWTALRDLGWTLVLYVVLAVRKALFQGLPKRILMGAASVFVTPRGRRLYKRLIEMCRTIAARVLMVMRANVKNPRSRFLISIAVTLIVLVAGLAMFHVPFIVFEVPPIFLRGLRYLGDYIWKYIWNWLTIRGLNESVVRAYKRIPKPIRKGVKYGKREYFQAGVALRRHRLPQWNRNLRAYALKLYRRVKRSVNDGQQERNIRNIQLFGSAAPPM